MKNNSIGGKSWRLTGQWLEYEFEVEEDGYYLLSFYAKQNFSRGTYVSRKIYLDGKVPFDKPETVTVSAEQLMKLYSNGSINREKNNKSIENQTKAKLKSKEQKKEVKKDIVER